MNKILLCIVLMISSSDSILLAQDLNVVFSSNLDNTNGVNANDNTGADLYSVNFNPTTKNVSNIRRLTNNKDIPETFSSQSPDGKWLAYNARVGGNQEIHLMHLESGKVTKVFDGRFPEFINNNELYVTYLKDNIQDIYKLTLDLAASTPKLISSIRLTDRTKCPGTSVGSDAYPFGNSAFIFNTLRAGGQTGAALAKINEDGSGFKLLTEWNGSGHAIATKDLKTILCTSSQTGKALQLSTGENANITTKELALPVLKNDLIKYDSRFNSIPFGSWVYATWAADEKSVFYSLKGNTNTAAVSRLMYVRFDNNWQPIEIIDFSKLVESLVGKSGKDFETVSIRVIPQSPGETNKKAPLYLNLVTHNELTDPIDYESNISQYNQMTSTVKKLADFVISKNARWNYQTCSEYVVATHKHQNAATNTEDILEYMDRTNQIDVDPRGKTDFKYKYNYADVVKLLDSAGVKDSKTVGGFIASPSNVADWEIFRSPIKPNLIKNASEWQAEILWGGGSFNHSQDLNNFGVWKPKNKVDFFEHDSNANLWFIGNGCSNVVTNTTNPDEIVQNITRITDLIASGALASDQFYSAVIMTNQRDFSDAYYQKITSIITSLEPLVREGKIIWATIREKLNAWKAFSANTGISYSQTDCDDLNYLSSTDNQEIQPEQQINDSLENSGIHVFPNPTSAELNITTSHIPNGGLLLRIYNSMGKEVLQQTIHQNTITLDLSFFEKGFYFLSLNGNKFKETTKIIIH